jgi:beta-mannosidase
MLRGKKYLVFMILFAFQFLLAIRVFPQSLNKGWVIYSDDGSVKINADVPSTVKMALLKAKSIPDPYFSTRNEESQWVEVHNWIYEKDFSFKKGKGRRYFLKIGGVAPRGEVYLNGELLGKIEGMFAQPLWDITGLLRDGANKLRIRILPEKERTKAIACQMSYGWDFAPRIIPLGVWRPVEIVESGEVLLKNPFLRLIKLEGNKAIVNLTVGYDSAIQGKAGIRIKLEGANFKGKGYEFKKEVEIEKGEGILNFDFAIQDVKLWYPAGFGPQNLYKVSLSLLLGKATSSSLSFLWGARQLEWEKNPDTNEIYPWIVKVNGIRIFSKGANWVPADSLYDLSPQRYERLVKLASFAGINMFRIWGGGIMEEDILYELCDRYGIMLWQEFPLACADYPDLPRDAFLENASNSIFRLRNHPSLVLWCGGNEFDPDNQANRELIDGLDKLCKALDGTRPFHRASPYGGDVHDWSVWHGSAPYTNYRQFTVFRSEAGLQSPPPEEDMLRFLSTSGIFPPSEEWSYHLADARKIEIYAKQYGRTSDLKNFLKKAQLAQAITYQFNLDSCLKNIWRNSGCLIWQFNDPWPNISWSMVDWYGNPKPSLYWFKKASSPINLAIDYDKTTLRVGESLNIGVYAINLTTKGETCQAEFTIASPKNILKRLSQTLAFPPQQSIRLWSFNFQIPPDYKEGVVFLIARVKKDGKIISEKIYPIPVMKVRGFSKPLKALVILSTLGQEAKGWREIGDLLIPFGVKLDIAPADSLPDLEGYDCFIIGESEGIGNKLSRQAMERIADLMSLGKGLLLDGGWNAYAEGGLKGTIIEEISPFVVKENSLREHMNLGIIVKSPDHPILRGLSFSRINIGGYNEEGVREGAKVLLSLSNGSPLLAEIGYGKGKCLAYASGLRGGWAVAIRGWDKYPLFLARLLGYLANREGEIENLEEEAIGLDNLPQVNLKIEGRKEGKRGIITLSNPSNNIAFFLRIKAEGLEVQPIFSDNYFFLLPGEKKEVSSELPKGKFAISVEDWQGRIWRLEFANKKGF